MKAFKPGQDVSIETRAAAFKPMNQASVTLVVLSGSQRGATKRVEQRITIGKARENDLVLPDDTVSRIHCEVIASGEGIRIRDLGSTNGTKVDGMRVADAFIQAGSLIKVGEVEIAVRLEASRIEVMPSEREQFGEALGKSLPMRQIFALLERIAKTDATVLFQGETGTGKDVLARSVVSEGPRKGKPFVIVDCGAVNYSLIESELFGHEKGAFTGAVAMRQGAFEIAHNGTLFLDEIGELPLDVQPKLLRVLETKEFRRVGGNAPIRSDVRVIAASKRDLAREVKLGKFREDLYFRLAVVPVTVPPLRARREDIAALVTHMIEKADGGSSLQLKPETMAALEAHDWPGNVRELRNVLERALYMAKADGRKEVELVMVPGISAGGAGVGGPGASGYSFDPTESYRDTRARHDQEFERAYLKWLLSRHSGNLSAAAREARMDRKHLYDMAKKHNLRGDSEE
ncbi:MAG: sigma 54-interacting transcriptional regulator [Polyangiaceae bacterium]